MGDVMNKRAEVNLVHVTGLGRTKDLVVAKIIEKVFGSKTFGDIVKTATDARHQLKSIGLKEVQFEIDTAKGPNTTDYDYDLTFKVKENSRLNGYVKASIGNQNDGKLIAGLSSRNILGAGELASFGYHRGFDRKDFAVQLELAKPLAPWSLHNPTLNLIGYQEQQSVKVSSFDQTNRGFDLNLIYRINKYLTHKLSMQNVWREISPADRETPIKVREEAGHSLKSSLKSVLTYDSRNDSVFSSRGVLFRATQEYAGLYGNVGFYKQELDFNYFQRLPFFRRIVLETSFTTGFMKTLENRVVCINDKFFLGGPLTLRGFKHFGIGPQSRSRPLGGTSMWLAGLHLHCPLPFIASSWKDNFRLQLFANAGNIVDTNESNVHNYDYRMIKALTNNVRVSYGAGLVIRLDDNAKIELNYVLPVKSQDSDLTDSGVQFGIGFTF